MGQAKPTICQDEKDCTTTKATPFFSLYGPVFIGSSSRDRTPNVRHRQVSHDHYASIHFSVSVCFLVHFYTSLIIALRFLACMAIILRMPHYRHGTSNNKHGNSSPLSIGNTKVNLNTVSSFLLSTLINGPKSARQGRAETSSSQLRPYVKFVHH